MISKSPSALKFSAYIIIAVLLLPLIYLLIRAVEVPSAELWQYLWRFRNLELLINSLSLIFGVLLVTSCIALPLAYLITRCDLRGKKVLTLLSVAPLAIPGYVMAYAWLSLSGDYGLLARLFDWNLPRVSGYWGALLVLSLYTFPYLFLNVRNALLGLDSKLEDAAKGMGASSLRVFYQVTLPQLRPALLSSWLIIGVYVLSDFGAVSLMRYETFSYAVYLQYANSFDRSYAAVLALLAIGLTAMFLLAETYLLRRYSHMQQTAAALGYRYQHSLKSWRIAAYGFIVLLLTLSLGVPVLTMLLWLQHAELSTQFYAVIQAAASSLSVALPASLLAAALGFMIAYHSVYFPSRLSRGTEQLAFLAYAMPPITLALAFIFLSLNLPFGLYQSFPVLILAYVMHYLALALGPIRSRLYQIPRSLHEASYSLNRSAYDTFIHITFGLSKKAYLTAAAMVFMLLIKELPLTFLLAPAGFTTLATNVWSYSSEAMFAQAAPYALLTCIVSSLFLGLVLKYEGKNDKFKRKAV